MNARGRRSDTSSRNGLQQRFDRIRSKANLGRLFEIVGTDVLVWDATRAPYGPRARVAIQIRKVSGAAGDDLRDVVPQRRWSDVAVFQARGDIGFVASVDDRFAGWIWLSRVSHRDPWSGLHIQLAADEGYAYALWVAPEHRPNAVAAVLFAQMLRHVRDDPSLTRVYGWVDKRNRESQALLRYFGFVQVQEVKRVHLLHRLGRQLPGSDKPPFGPLSANGRHSE